MLEHDSPDVKHTGNLVCISLDLKHRWNKIVELGTFLHVNHNRHSKSSCVKVWKLNMHIEYYESLNNSGEVKQSSTLKSC